jgi:DNA polymerase
LFEEWRRHARALAAAHVPPQEVAWAESEPLFAPDPSPETSEPLSVPKEFAAEAPLVACFRAPSRWALLYRVLFRLTHGERHLLSIDTDDDTRRFHLMAKSVRRDIHKTHAFVRFRESGEWMIAYHRPDHLTLPLSASFFARRFGSMRWAILTPDASAWWDLTELRFGPGAPRSAAPAADELEDLWRAYYASTFNPARLNPDLMKKELPVRHWATLPEAALFPELLAGAERRTAAMIDTAQPSAAEFVPLSRDPGALAEAARACRGCDLWRDATQTVFGAGPRDARIVMVGEQPGDREDLDGAPFVGPAGQLLDRALEAAGLARSDLYLTNAVKHFKFTREGKRRIHATPRGREISACKPWLEAELEATQPECIVCLGLTALQSVAGRRFALERERGRFFPHPAAPLGAFATVHPSALLRMPDPVLREREFSRFVSELRIVAETVPRRP